VGAHVSPFYVYLYIAILYGNIWIYGHVDEHVIVCNGCIHMYNNIATDNTSWYVTKIVSRWLRYWMECLHLFCATHRIITLPHASDAYQFIIFILNLRKVLHGRGLVNMSANCSVVHTACIVTRPSPTASRK
jgi:hypothetical protein